MAKPYFKVLGLFLAVAFFFGCNAQQKADVEVQLTVSLNGKPLSGAQVSIDAAPAGETDAQGRLVQRLQKLPGQEVSLAVKAQVEGYHLSPWQQSFVTKLPQNNAVQIYPFDVKLSGKKYFTLAISCDDESIPGASISIQNKRAGQSDANGYFEHTFTRSPAKGLIIQVEKQGYHTWKERIRVKPGTTYQAELKKKVTQVAAKQTPPPEPAKKVPQASVAQPKPAPAPKKPAPAKKASASVLTIVAHTDAYGVSKALPSVVVHLNGRKIGKTDSRGQLAYRTTSLAGKKADLKLTAPGHIPEQWETTLTLSREKTVRHYFYPALPPAINVGVYGYINNSPDADVEAALEEIEASVRANLFLHKSFQETPKNRLRDMLLQYSLDMETISTKGWQHTPLVDQVDMIISGSVTRNAQGFVIETTVTTANGKTLLSQLNTARRQRDIKRTCKLIVAGIIDQFPFEGTIAAIDADGYRTNLGTLNYKIRRGNQFRYMAACMSPSGKISGYEEKGLLRVVKTDDTNSWAEVISLKDQQTIKVGDKIVRRIYLEEEREAAKSSFIVAVNSETAPVWGVNVYLNNTWVGTTGANGKAVIPVRLHDEYDLLLSRHGYQPVQETVRIDEKQVSRDFTLQMANALFKIESDPSGAEVFIDNISIGQTPIIDGKLVNFGFRKVRLSVGGEYRDWQHVMEFNKSEVDFTGPRRIALMKDWYRIGQMAEQSNDVEGAIAAYASIERKNPDYSDARHRLAQIYMDEKNDFDGAIREFENVLALPENQQIIYKQFAITYTNLGHAYYEKGNKLVWSDKRAAANNLAKAIEKLKIARQNTRFFPNQEFNEAVHDTYYYLAIAYHKLYLVTKQKTLLPRAKQAWQDYFDFFPKQLNGRSTFEDIRNAARKYYGQIKDLS